MKKNIRKSLGLIFSLTLIIGILSVLLMSSKTVEASSEYYILGEKTVQSQRLEAESASQHEGKVSTPSVGTKSCFVSGSIVELSATGGSATYNVNMETSGEFVVKIAYFSGDSSKNPQLSVAVNEGTPIVSSVLAINGWATAGEIWTYYVNITVELNEGMNKIFISQDSSSTGYVNLDFIEIYKSNDVYYYPIESKLDPELAGNYTIGERIEAEWMTYSGSAKVTGLENTTVYNPLSGKLIELNAHTASFKLDVEKAGTYAVKIAYYTGSTSTSMMLDVITNGVTTTTSPLQMNGWGKVGNMSTLYIQVNVNLVEGVNEIKIKQNSASSGYYINFDFVEFYELDNVKYYPIEKNLYPDLAGANLVGERIEAESGFHVNKSGRCYAEITGANISGTLLYLGSSPLQYSVYAEEAGTYYLQIANYSAGDVGSTTSMKYKMTIAGKTYELTSFKLESYGAGNSYLQNIAYFEVELEKGINVFQLNSISATNKTHTDFFKFFKKTDNIDKVGQFEDYAVGSVKVLKSEQTYEEIDEFAAEFNTVRSGEIVVPVTASEAGYYDLYVRSWCGSAEGAFDLSINNGETKAYLVGNTGWVSAGGIQQPIDNVYRIYLNAGENTLKFTKNAAAYVDFDWFYITKEKTLVEPNNGNGYKINVNEELILSDLDITVKDSNIATSVGGKIIGLAGGKTEIYVSYTMDNGYVLQRKYDLTVEKIDYTGNELLAENQNVAYDGQPHYYNAAVAPEGWSVVYSNNDTGLTTPGSKEITIKFVHDSGVYNDVLMSAILTVTKGDYTGNDLVVEDVFGIYDGTTEYTVEATAPEGWDINYSSNGRVVEGVTTVTVTFSHPYYNDVVKTADITVNYAAKAVAASVSLEGDLALNFYFSIMDEVFADATAKLVFTVDGEIINVDLTEGVVNGEYYVFTYKVAAKDYKKVVYAKIQTSLGICEEKHCSIESYANYVEQNKDNEKYAKCAQLVADMKEYCEAARVYFNNEVAEEKYNSVTKEVLVNYAAKIEGELPSDVKILGATLILETTTSIRVYFSATNTVVASAIALDGVKNVYYLEVNNIVAKDLATEVVFEIGSCKIYYSALSYSYSVLNSDSSSIALENVVKALYKYSMSACDYWK